MDNEIEKISRIRDLLIMIQKGAPVEEIKEKFKEILSSVSPWEIPLIEQELVKAGASVDEITALCDAHVDLFRDFIASKINFEAYPDGHPLRTFIEENNQILKDVELLGLYLSGYLNSNNEKKRKEYFESMKKLVKELFGIKNHFVRQQMLLFPYLERIGITAVPQVLWMKQDEVYFTLKELARLLNNYDDSRKEELKRIVNEFIRVASDMVFRENNIFFPTMAVILGEAEWYAVHLQSEKIGYYKVSPREYNPNVKPRLPYKFKLDDPRVLDKLPKEVRRVLGKLGLNPDYYEVRRKGDIHLNYGYLGLEELNAMLESLPIEITFVGSDGRTRYFTNTEHQIFVRTPSVIGRKVEFCHPPRSIELVKSIVDSFKKGRRKPYVFWTKIKGRTIRVEYKPVIKNEKLIGIMEIVMDLTEIKETIEKGRIPYFKSMTLKQLKETIEKKLKNNLLFSTPNPTPTSNKKE